MNFYDLMELYQANQTAVSSLAALIALGMVLLVAHRLRKMAAHRATLLVANILTFIAAALATMVSASGMWQFFTDVLGESPLRYVFFWFIEVALLASALLARARLLREPEKGSTGVDGAAVWVFASLTATLSALDAKSFQEVCLRLAAPLVAAWMWERALAAERSTRLGRTATRINWTITWERVFVWLKLAEAQGRDVTEVDRARRRARLGRARLDLYLLQGRPKTAAWRMRRAHNRVIRLAMSSAEHTGLADFPHANEREAIQMYMATLYGFVNATAPEAVSHLNAWRVTLEDSERGGQRPSGHDHITYSAEPRLVPALAGPVPLAGLPLQRLNGHSHDDARELDPASQHSQVDTGPDVDYLGSPVPGWTSASDGAPTDEDDEADDTDDTDDTDEAAYDDDADVSAVAAMRRYWETEISAGRVPKGSELSLAANVLPTTGQGRRMRRKWIKELPDHLRSSVASAGDRP